MVFDQALVTEELIEERWAQATEPDTLASARRMYGRGVLQAMAAAAERSAAPPYWAMLHKVTARTLITWGRDDRVSPLDMALVPMRTIPDVELHVLPSGAAQSPNISISQARAGRMRDRMDAARAATDAYLTGLTPP